MRRLVIMDTTRARAILGWAPRQDARQTLEATVHARAQRLMRYARSSLGQGPGPRAKPLRKRR